MFSWECGCFVFSVPYPSKSPHLIMPIKLTGQLQTMLLLKISYRMAHREEKELSLSFTLKKFNLLRLGNARIW